MLIVVANPKGGVGKSTIATNLAVMFAIRKHVVTLLDVDRQKSSYKFCLLRDNIGVQPKIKYDHQTDDIRDVLQIVCHNSDTVIVDVGGKRGPEAAYALAQADELIVPLTTSQFDTWALNDMLPMLDQLRDAGAGFRSRVVLNNTPYHKNSVEVRVTRDALNNYMTYFQPCDTAVVGRGVFKEALLRGLSVVETDREGKATENLNELFKELFE